MYIVLERRSIKRKERKKNQEKEIKRIIRCKLCLPCAWCDYFIFLWVLLLELKLNMYDRVEVWSWVFFEDVGDDV